jgi:hypothetical protein
VEPVKSKSDAIIAHPLIIQDFLTESKKAKVQEAYNNYINGTYTLARYRRTVTRNLFLEGITHDSASSRKYLETVVRHARYLETNKDEE